MFPFLEQYNIYIPYNHTYSIACFIYRTKLSAKYGESVINHTSGIPAHLLGKHIKKIYKAIGYKIIYIKIA